MRIAAVAATAACLAGFAVGTAAARPTSAAVCAAPLGFAGVDVAAYTRACGSCRELGVVRVAKLYGVAQLARPAARAWARHHPGDDVAERDGCLRGFAAA